MDDQHFDSLARSLASGRSRRTAVRLLAGGALGALLTALGLEEAGAACVRVGRRCETGRQCCTKRCVRGRCACPRGTTRCGRRCCPAGQTCQNGACVAACAGEDPTVTCAANGCGPKTNSCNQTVDCGTCQGDLTCQNGFCACPNGLTACSTNCVDTNTNRNHCGGCDQACSSTQVCELGVCKADGGGGGGGGDCLTGSPGSFLVAPDPC